MLDNGYEPKPIDTSGIVLPEEILDLTEQLAASTHDVWAKGKIAKGYVYGETTSDENKTHADLIPYGELSEEKRDYDRQTAMETLKAIYALGFEVKKRKTHDGIPYSTDRHDIADHEALDEIDKRDRAYL